MKTWKMLRDLAINNDAPSRIGKTWPWLCTARSWRRRASEMASTMNQHINVFRNFIADRQEKNQRIYLSHLMCLRRRWDARLSNVTKSLRWPRSWVGKPLKKSIVTAPLYRHEILTSGEQAPVAPQRTVSRPSINASQ